MRKVLAVVMSLAVSASPCFAQQNDDLTDVCMKAEWQAERDSHKNEWLWFGGSCLFPLIGVGAAFLIEPSPPMYRLVGKPPEYQRMYIDCYKSKAKEKQINNAVLGAVTGIAIVVGLWAIAAASTPSETY